MGKKIEGQLPLSRLQPSAALILHFRLPSLPKAQLYRTSPLFMSQRSHQPQRSMVCIFWSHSRLKLSNFYSNKPLVNRTPPGIWVPIQVSILLDKWSLWGCHLNCSFNSTSSFNSSDYWSIDFRTHGGLICGLTTRRWGWMLRFLVHVCINMFCQESWSTEGSQVENETSGKERPAQSLGIAGPEMGSRDIRNRWEQFPFCWRYFEVDH